MTTKKKLLQAAAGNSGEQAGLLIQYAQSSPYIKIFDVQNNYTDVTSTYISGNLATSVAASHERMIHPWRDDGTRSKHIGFAGWGQSSAEAAAIVEITNSGTWNQNTGYDNTVFQEGSQPFAQFIVPQGNDGNFFWFNYNDYLENGVNKITNPTSANVGSQYANINDNNVTSRNAAAWGNYLMVSMNDGTPDLYLTSFNQSTGATALISSDTLSLGQLNALKISKSGNVIAVSNNTGSSADAIKIYKDYHISQYSGSISLSSNVDTHGSFTGASGNNIEALGISDDDKYVAVAYRRGSVSPYWGVVVIEVATGTKTYFNVPAGSGTNCRPRDIVWYPDNKHFFVGGYSNAPNVLFNLSDTSSSGYINFGSTYSHTWSVHGVSVLPVGWEDNY
jgi:hypothetical protein